MKNNKIKELDKRKDVCITNFFAKANNKSNINNNNEKNSNNNANDKENISYINSTLKLSSYNKQISKELDENININKISKSNNEIKNSSNINNNYDNDINNQIKLNIISKCEFNKIENQNIDSKDSNIIKTCINSDNKELNTNKLTSVNIKSDITTDDIKHKQKPLSKFELKKLEYLQKIKKADENNKILEQKAIEKKLDKLQENIKLNKNNLLLTDIYAPITSKDIVGNTAIVSKLRNWLLNWNIRSAKSNIKTSQGIKNNVNLNENDYAKACLISGPPGIGKTTTAKVLCNELGFNIHETNSSDQRSKSILELGVGFLSNNKVVSFENNSNNIGNISKVNKTAIIMDEIDGMAGNEDKGGFKKLIEIIINTKVPIICICNDRGNKKLKSLLNYVYDLKFNKPELRHITLRLSNIIKQENINISSKEIEEIAESSGGDIRQSINMLEYYNISKRKELNNNSSTFSCSNLKKDMVVSLNPFESANKLLNINFYRCLSNEQKINLFFIDFDLVYLLIQENYLSSLINKYASNYTKNTVNNISAKFKNLLEYKEELYNLSLTSDLLSYGDILDSKIKKNSQWTLIGDKAIITVCIVCNLACYSANYIKFPSIIGSTSKINKTKKLINELKKPSNNMSDYDIINMYNPIVLNNLLNLLKENKIQESVDFIVKTKLDLNMLVNNIVELSNNYFKNKYDNLNNVTKRQFISKYNDIFSLNRKHINTNKSNSLNINNTSLKLEGLKDLNEDVEDSIYDEEQTSE